MKKIRLNKICVNVFGELGILPSLIDHISENDVKVLHNHKGSCVFVFDTAANVGEIKDFLTTGENTFFVFDLITGGDIVIGSDLALEEQSLTKVRMKDGGEFDVDISKMDSDAREAKIDELLDKGVKRLDDIESVMLNKLSKEI